MWTANVWTSHITHLSTCSFADAAAWQLFASIDYFEMPQENGYNDANNYAYTLHKKTNPIKT